MRTDYSYIGSGRILVRRRNVAGAGFVEMGNCSALALAVESEVKQLRDFRAPGGGTYNRVDRITAVNVSLTRTTCRRSTCRWRFTAPPPP